MLAATLLLFVLATAAIVFPKAFLCVDNGPAKADVIIVLGGAAWERPEYAAELFKEHAAPEIIVSGAGDNQIARLILLKDGVPPDAIRMESKSRTTSENARYSIEMMRQDKMHSAIIVTSWYHSRRALKCFEHYAPELQFFSWPAMFESTHWQWMHKEEIKRVYLEYLKLPGYWVRYGVSPF
jgi:uncharacterized SAM-binding protein YcdF (DUF218 family)